MKQFLLAFVLSLGLASCGSSTRPNEDIVAPPTPEPSWSAKPEAAKGLDLENTLYLDLLKRSCDHQAAPGPCAKPCGTHQKADPRRVL